MTTTKPPGDIRALLGMHTVAARILVGVYAAAITIITFETREGLAAFWPSLLSLLVLISATVVLIAAPGDPLPRPATVGLTAAGPLAAVLTLSVVPTPLAVPLQAWTHGGATTIYCFMCVRGRVGSAWTGMAATIAAYTAWAYLTEQGALVGFVMTVIDLGPLGMATVLSYTLRPNAKLTFELRAAAERQIADEAAAAATLDERDQRLSLLDELARPMLERVMEETPLSDAEKLSCELLEAHLRDRLRAPALIEPATNELVRDARIRGVDVDLIDDHGMDNADESVREAILCAVGEALLTAHSGAVRIRIHPPGRPTTASILVHSDDEVRRVDYDHFGQAMSSPTANPR
jgi:hypothetical protein